MAAQSDTAKVNSARLRKDVTIVWASWLSDSIALWRRQREEDYAVDIGPSTLPLPTKVDPDPPPIPTPPTIEDDIDVDAVNGEEGSEGAVELDWDDADRELEDMLNETDSDTEGPNKGKKRARSRSASLEPIEGAKTGSPLSKRQKMASNRKSKLKIAHDAEGVVDSAPPSGGSRASDAGSDEDFDGIEGLADFL